MYAEVVVDRHIVKRDRRSFIETPQDAEIPYPETEKLAEPDLPPPPPPNPLALTFHYHVPPHLIHQIQVGQLVAVPFRTQQLPAIVVGLSDRSPVEQTKPVAAILDPLPVVTPAQISLAYWLSRETLASLATCLKYFLPPGSSRKPEWMLKPTPAANQEIDSLDAPEQILLTYLRRHGAASLAEVDSSAAETLIEKGLARKEATLSKPRTGPKTERMVELLIPPDEVEAVLPSLGHKSKQADLLLHLANLDDPLPTLTDVLVQTDCTREHAKSLAEKGWLEIIPSQTLLTIPPNKQATIKAALPTTDETGPLSTRETASPNLASLIRSEAGQQILRYLNNQGQPILIGEVLSTTGATRSSINTLLKKELITRFDEPERITLTLPATELTEAIIELRGAQKHSDVLKLLAAEDGPVWIGWIYAQTEATLQTLRDLAQADLISLDEARRWRDPLAGRSFTLDTPPELTPEQQAAWQEGARHWQQKFDDRRPILLHGVTGSGKTEIYLRAMAVALKAGQGTIMLVPEITLATQTVERVSARFPGKVAVWHSALSPGERYDTWERVRAGELPIVVGPRSALFAPVKNLGVIVVDEEHEPVYKQRDRAPIFHAREAAIELGRLNQALVILGSATPDIVTYRRAERGEYRLLSLPTRILAHTKHLAVQEALIRRRNAAREGGTLHVKAEQPPAANGQPSAFVTLPLPKVEVVDLREELKAGNRTIFSRALQDGIHQTLRHGEQVILFLNRRGAASFVICRDCGYVMTCPRCETTLTYHTSGELMTCHYCGYRARPVETCPECHSDRIRYFGLGTQRVEEAVQKMFPQAQTIRWDWDTTRRKGSHEVFLHHFMAGRANVMVGTQMVAKGLDLPLVTLVGVISADTALYLPDFRAAERSFQLLMQVAGRAGRSPLGGRVIVQTYNPDQVAIEAAANHDYEGFYHTELVFRHEQNYPPFKRLALLLYSGPGPERSAAEAQKVAERIRLHVERHGLPTVEVIGPTPGYVRRVRSQYRWHILLRAQDPAAVLRPMMPLPQGWRVDIDPVTLL